MGKIICSDCGAELDDKVNVCPECGNPISKLKINGLIKKKGNENLFLFLMIAIIVYRYLFWPMYLVHMYSFKFIVLPLVVILLNYIVKRFIKTGLMWDFLSLLLVLIVPSNLVASLIMIPMFLSTISSKSLKNNSMIGKMSAKAKYILYATILFLIVYHHLNGEIIGFYSSIDFSLYTIQYDLLLIMINLYLFYSRKEVK